MIFSDEKKFNLDGPDGFNCYWRDLRKEPRFFTTRNFGGGSVMVWAAFCSVDKLQLRFTISKMNSAEYIEVLNASLESLFVDDFIEFRWFFNKIMRASTRAKKLWHGLDVRKSTFWTGLLEVLIWIRLRIYGASLCAESTPKIDNSKRLMLSKAPSKQLGRQSTVKWFKT